MKAPRALILLLLILNAVGAGGTDDFSRFVPRLT
jgi:hypothetical protein